MNAGPESPHLPALPHELPALTLTRSPAPATQLHAAARVPFYRILPQLHVPLSQPAPGRSFSPAERRHGGAQAWGGLGGGHSPSDQESKPPVGGAGG